MASKEMKYGPTKSSVKRSTNLSWWLVIAGKRWSNVPILKKIIDPFFRRPDNDITSIPINVDVKGPDNVTMPRQIIKRLLADIDEKFLFDECTCRVHNNVDWPPRDIGCMALGPGVRTIHPSHGRMITTEEALRHVDRAADAGLVANVAHSWIDPASFKYNFDDVMFICYCDDKNCLYRTYMKNRGPSLDGAYQRLPGISVSVDKSKCKGCGVCIDQCFLANITLVNGKSEIGPKCAGCGRCVDRCSNKAITMTIKNEDELYSELVQWIRGLSKVPIKHA